MRCKTLYDRVKNEEIRKEHKMGRLMIWERKPDTQRK